MTGPFVWSFFVASLTCKRGNELLCIIAAELIKNMETKKSLPKFSSLEYLDGKPMVNKENPLLYFADVCAGPGGFSEYVLWRKKWKSKGFGFTLRGPNDFKLEDFFAGPRESLFIRLPGFVQTLENLV